MQNIAVNKNEILEEKEKVRHELEKEDSKIRDLTSSKKRRERRKASQRLNSTELSEKETLEAQNIVRAIELEIEAIKVKGQFEKTFLRFPHIAEQIFESLEIQNFSKCQEVSKCWKEFIFQSKPFFQQLENYTSIPRSMLKKSLKNYNFQTLNKMANCASISYEKADQATIPFKKSSLLEPKGPLLFYYILSQEKLNRTQFLLAKLMLLNNMSTSNSCNQNSSLILSKEFNVNDSFSSDDQKAFDYSIALLILSGKLWAKANFGEVYTRFNEMVNEKRGEWGSIWSWITILHVAVAQNHLAICKLIFKQIQDIHLLHSWGKVVLQRALLFGHRDMCEFLIDEIQEIDLLAEKNWSGRNLIQMAEDLGLEEICTLFDSFMQKQK